MNHCKWLFTGACAGVIALVMAGSGHAGGESPQKAKFKPSSAYVWLDIALEATAREHERTIARPTVGSRMLAIIATAMYDAWAAYDAKAVGTRLAGKLRRPAAERTDANKTKAIAYACYRAMLFQFPEDEKWIREQMVAHGFNPDDDSTDITTPQGIGNVAAAAVAEYRRNDGANQYGNEVGSSGKAYSDWTFYQPVNTIDKNYDPDHWQQIPFLNAKTGGTFYPNFLTPHWYRVQPFALKRSDQFRSPPPYKVGSPEMKKEVDELVKMNGNLSVEEKAVVEFMRDGPKSTGQSGHWLRFAQAVSRRDHHGIDKDIKLFFAVANAVFDAFIACWDVKRFYDGPRPWALIRHYYKGQKIKAWAGPGKGYAMIPAEKWHPYSPSTFVTPPFPGYVSGHSTASAAGARTLELFTGSDRFADVENRVAGTLTEPGFPCHIMQMVNGEPVLDSKASCAVALQLPTFTATALMAGESRILGGYHVRVDNVEGLKLGKNVADYIWPKMKGYFDGTASGAPEASAVAPKAAPPVAERLQYYPPLAPYYPPQFQYYPPPWRNPFPPLRPFSPLPPIGR